MPRTVFVGDTPETLDPSFARLRAELEVPEAFPAQVEAAASAAAAEVPTGYERVDRREPELFSIDPPGSRDLDQAMCLQRRGSGYRVFYAIADVAAFVTAGDAVDGEARRRGVTVYCPDRRIPLHPTQLSEGAASLLAGEDRPAVLWCIDLDQRGEVADVSVQRALVRNRLAANYPVVQAELDSGTPSPALSLLVEIGTLRQERERDRGGVSLDLPGQQVVAVDGRYRLELDRPRAVERHNAQISLLTGMAAAALMIDAGVGILRVLPLAPPELFDRLARSSRALGVPWPEVGGYPAWVRSLDAGTPVGAALVNQAARAFQGATYVAFDGDLPPGHKHAAIAAPYAHVTAPLRRLVDRFANGVVLAAGAGRRPDPWVLEALGRLPELMAQADRRASSVDRACVDLVEAAVLAPRVGEVFSGTVVATGPKDRITVQLHEPAVIVSVAVSGCELGGPVALRLDAADPDTRSTSWSRTNS